MTRTDQNARDDAIVLAALPCRVMWLRVIVSIRTYGANRVQRTRDALDRLKRAGLVCYSKETKIWERTK